MVRIEYLPITLADSDRQWLVRCSECLWFASYTGYRLGQKGRAEHISVCVGASSLMKVS